MIYRFHKEGRNTLALALLISVLITGVAILTGIASFIVLASILCLILLVVVLQFFRNPVRSFVNDNTRLISPADGKVVVVEEVFESEYLKAKAIQVSIFMSPFNVHINRFPGTGKVSYFKYHPGKYLVAWHPKSSTENERTSLGLQIDGFGTVLIRQIAGALARRIVCYAEPEETCAQNEEFGFIKFGSRVDIFLPKETTILVKPGDITKGGITPIALAKSS